MNVRAICFDLDDTLWDIWPTIARAEQRLHAWLAERHPEIPRRYSPEELRLLAREVVAQRPEIGHDRTLVRKLALKLAAERCGSHTRGSSDGTTRRTFSSIASVAASRTEAGVRADMAPRISTTFPPLARSCSGATTASTSPIPQCPRRGTPAAAKTLGPATAVSWTRRAACQRQRFPR